MGKKNETYCFKWTYDCYLRTGGVKSRIIEEGACNKNYPTELRVFSKRSNSDHHLIRFLDFSHLSKKNQKKTATAITTATATKLTTD